MFPAPREKPQTPAPRHAARATSARAPVHPAADNSHPPKRESTPRANATAHPASRADGYFAREVGDDSPAPATADDSREQEPAAGYPARAGVVDCRGEGEAADFPAPLSADATAHGPASSAEAPAGVLASPAADGPARAAVVAPGPAPVWGGKASTRAANRPPHPGGAVAILAGTSGTGSGGEAANFSSE